MLTGHSLVYFAPGKWDGLWRNRHQLMSVFARHNKVVFVERRLRLPQTLTGFRRGDLGLSDLFRPPIRQISQNLSVFRYPIWAPACGRYDHVAKRVRRLAIRDALRRLHISNPIVWFSFPSMINEVKEVPDARLQVYHVVDEYSAYASQTPAGRRRLQEQERKMLDLVDAVIVVSKKLYEAKRPFNRNTYLVPNGVNYQAYAAALADPHLPDDLIGIRAPRLGYIGLIGDKLDLGMLKNLAEENPEWSLVLLGNVQIEEQVEAWCALQALPNVYQLGPVDVSQVPYYVKGFHVGLMPYLQNRHSEHISPLKLYDYLAAGLPVASTDIPAAREFGSHVHLADRPDSFAQAVSAALADTAPERRQARRSVAAQHAWEARVDKLSELIEARLAAKDQSTKKTR
jgi:glycosyltransferase involved in cell wall biosynthesis